MDTTCPHACAGMVNGEEEEEDGAALVDQHTLTWNTLKCCFLKCALVMKTLP